jgi:hypothetical protein
MEPQDIAHTEDEWDKEDEDTPPNDDITIEDLMCVLQEQFNNEWEEELHDLRKFQFIKCGRAYTASLITFSTGGEELTDEDLDNISMFALCREGSGLSRATFNRLQHSFDTNYI